MNPSRVLVTGGAGFIGSHAVDHLLDLGCRVHVVDDLSSGHLDNLERASARSGYSFTEMDITEEGALLGVCEEISPDAIIHLAGLVSVVRGQEEPDLNYLLNLHSTQIVAEAARRSGVGRIVFASSAAVYGDCPDLPLSESATPNPLSQYGLAKFLSEQLLQGYALSYGLEAVSLRFFNVFGPRQDPTSPYSGVISLFAQCFADKRAVTIFGDGEQTRDFVSVYDVARALSISATRSSVKSAVINVCTGRASSVMDVWRGLKTLYPDGADPDFQPMRDGEITNSTGDSSLACRYLDFTAERALQEGLEELVQDLDD
tara:strand:+ start:1201 stop:2148 length:948 start_codon:yes stop_codon:yes gene_type:complete